MIPAICFIFWRLLYSDSDMEGTEELHQTDDTKRTRRMMQKNSSDPIPSLLDVDALEVESTVSEVNDIIYSIKVKNVDELKNLFRAGSRLVCRKLDDIAQKKTLKNHSGKAELNMILRVSEKIWVKLRIGLKIDGRIGNIEEKMNWEVNIASRPKDLKL